jgi:ABC-type multidrug transport system ATPase subunit
VRAGPAGQRSAGRGRVGRRRASLGYLAELFRFPGWYSAEEVLELHQRLTGSPGGVTERLDC